MSNVRLSSGSPTLERGGGPGDAARVSELLPPKPSACRALFGSVDHEELRRELKGHLLQMDGSASQRWNFDFHNHSPLTGRLQWELVDCRDVPDFYSRQQRERESKKGVCPSSGNNNNNNVDLNGNHSCVVVSSGGEEPTPVETCREQCTGPRKRPACHEPPSAQQHKRSHTSSSEEGRCPTSSSTTHSAERTPRKSSPRRQT